METVKAFYFSCPSGKLRFGDDREIVVGETHSVGGFIKAGKNGLHASRKIIDALKYSPWWDLYIVELSGDIDDCVDKLAARNRKYITKFNAKEVLRKFMSSMALETVELIKPYCNEDEYNCVVDYLNGDTSEADGARSVAYDVCGKIYDLLYYNGVIPGYNKNLYDAHNASKLVYNACWECTYQVIGKTEESREKQNVILTEMIREATGWDI